MTRLTVHEYAAELRPRYGAAKRGVKQRILDEFCQTTGMHWASYSRWPRSRSASSKHRSGAAL